MIAMPHLNYHHLRYFWIIATEGNLTRAAERLHLSQSALSVQLGKLEAQLGHALFERQGKRLVLTEAGRIALDYAATVFTAGHDLLATLKGQAASRRVLRVGALTTLSRNFQLEFLRPVLDRPDTDIVIRSGPLRELIPQLEAQAIDVVLTNTPPRRDAGSPLHSHLLDRQPISLVGRPVSGEAPFRFPEDLAHVPVTLPGLESDIRADFDRVMALAGIRPIIRAEVDDMAMLRLMARESDGVTLVPPIVVRDELLSGRLVERCRLPDVTESFYAVVAERRFPNPLVSSLLSARGGVAAPDA